MMRSGEAGLFPGAAYRRDLRRQLTQAELLRQPNQSCVQEDSCLRAAVATQIMYKAMQTGVEELCTH